MATAPNQPTPSPRHHLIDELIRITEELRRTFSGDPHARRLVERSIELRDLLDQYRAHNKTENVK